MSYQWKESKMGFKLESFTTVCEGIIVKMSGKDMTEAIKFVGHDTRGHNMDGIYSRTPNRPIEIYDCKGNKHPRIKDKNAFYGKIYLTQKHNWLGRIYYLRPLEMIEN